jgi:hypothetical protein
MNIDGISGTHEPEKPPEAPKPKRKPKKKSNQGRPKGYSQGKSSDEVLANGETVRAFNARLRAEGRTDLWRSWSRNLSKRRGVTVAEIRREYHNLWDPGKQPTWGAPFDSGAEMPEVPAAGNDGSMWTSLEWVCEAFALIKSGTKPAALQPPGPRAFALYDWAVDNKEAFWKLYTSEAKKRTGKEGGEGIDERSALQIDECEELLTEMAAESRRMLDELQGKGPKIEEILEPYPEEIRQLVRRIIAKLAGEE